MLQDLIVPGKIKICIVSEENRIGGRILRPRKQAIIIEIKSRGMGVGIGDKDGSLCIIREAQ